MTFAPHCRRQAHGVHDRMACTHLMVRAGRMATNPMVCTDHTGCRPHGPTCGRSQPKMVGTGFNTLDEPDSAGSESEHDPVASGRGRLGRALRGRRDNADASRV